MDLEHFLIAKASTASLEHPLLRSGAEQEEMLALHRAAAQSAEQRIAGANHDSTVHSRLGGAERAGGRPQELNGQTRGSTP